MIVKLLPLVAFALVVVVVAVGVLLLVIRLAKRAVARPEEAVAGAELATATPEVVPVAPSTLRRRARNQRRRERRRAEDRATRPDVFYLVFDRRARRYARWEAGRLTWTQFPGIATLHRGGPDLDRYLGSRPSCDARDLHSALGERRRAD